MGDRYATTSALALAAALLLVLALCATQAAAEAKKLPKITKVTPKASAEASDAARDHQIRRRKRVDGHLDFTDDRRRRRPARGHRRVRRVCTEHLPGQPICQTGRDWNPFPTE